MRDAAFSAAVAHACPTNTAIHNFQSRQARSRLSPHPQTHMQYVVTALGNRTVLLSYRKNRMVLLLYSVFFFFFFV